jgi:hypothetical protein
LVAPFANFSAERQSTRNAERHAAAYILALPKSEQQSPEWQAALIRFIQRETLGPAQAEAGRMT